MGVVIAGYRGSGIRSAALKLASCSAIALAVGLVDFGAARAETRLEELVVTARKREESILDAPVAVTGLTQTDISRYNATNLTNLSQLVPSLNIMAGGGGSGASFSVRGYGSNSADAAIEQSVTVNLDGGMITRGNIVTNSFFDLQQVEVLKGPQALFFGKNSPAGVISLTSRSPGDHLQANAKAGYEFEAKERYFEGGVGGPLSSTLGARLAVYVSDMDGWQHNDAQPIPDPFNGGRLSRGSFGDLPARKATAFRGTLKFTPSDRFTALLKLQHTNYKDNGTGIMEVVNCAPGRSHPTTTVAFIPGLVAEDPNGDCAPNFHRSITGMQPADAAFFPGAGDGSLYTKTRTTLGTLNMTYDAGAMQFISVSSFYRLHMDLFDNFSNSGFAAYMGLLQERSRGVSQELRVQSKFAGPVNFMVGGFYDRSRLFFETVSSPFGPMPLDSGWRISAISAPSNVGHTWSAFGQLTWKITPELELAGGARWTKEVKDAVIVNSYLNPAVAFIFNRNRLTGHFSDTNVSPEVTLTWRPHPDTMLYAAYKTGYKSGGWSAPGVFLASQTINKLGFKPEKAKGGEIGAKGLFLDGRLSATAAIYDYRYTQLQLSSLDPASFTYFILNAPKAVTKGVEVESRFQATDDLLLRGSVNYNDGHYLEYKGASCYAGQTVATGCVGGAQDLSGTPLVQARKWTLIGGLTYTRPVTESLKFGVDVDVRYTSGFPGSLDDTPFFKPPSYTVINGALRLYNGAWEVALLGRNLTNEKIVVAVSNKPGALPGELNGHMARGREVALQFSYKID